MLGTGGSLGTEQPAAVIVPCTCVPFLSSMVTVSLTLQSALVQAWDAMLTAYYVHTDSGRTAATGYQQPKRTQILAGLTLTSITPQSLSHVV